MSTTIDNVYIAEFNQYLRQLAQQKFARLLPTVQQVASSGETYAWDRVGSKEASKKTTRAQATPVADFDFSRRISTASTYNIGELIEFEDNVQAKVDISGGLVRSMGMAMARAYDTEIIAGATGDVLDGDGATVSFPAGQTIDKSTVQISFDDITAVLEKFYENDIQGDVPKTAVISPAQCRRLLQLTEQTSGDYVNQQALQKLTTSGVVHGWMGMNWITSTMLTGAAGVTNCIFYTDLALGLAMNRPITSFLSQDPSRSYAYSLYSSATFGSCRIEDEQIVQLQVKDAA